MKIINELNMPSSASANNDIKQLFINGYFCYVYKFAIITNGLGIVRNMSDSPDEDKYISDSKSLKPVLTDYFNLHPNVPHTTYLWEILFLILMLLIQCF
jgi:hypothetical protein